MYLANLLLGIQDPCISRRQRHGGLSFPHTARSRREGAQLRHTNVVDSVELVLEGSKRQEGCRGALGWRTRGAHRFAAIPYDEVDRLSLLSLGGRAQVRGACRPAGIRHVVKLLDQHSLPSVWKRRRWDLVIGRDEVFGIGDS